MFLEGMIKMGKDIGIKDIYSDLFLIYFFFLCKAKQIDFLTEEEFASGLSALNVKEFKNVKNNMDKMQSNYMYTGRSNVAKLREFFAYLFTINVERKTKTIEYDYVEFYFQKAFPGEKKLVQEFLKFLQKKGKPKINKDQWTSLFDLLVSIGNEFPKKYEISSAWPVILDEFYIWYCKERGIEIKQEEDFSKFYN